MAIQRGITGFEDIAAALPALGAAIGQNIFPTRQKMSAIEDDPEAQSQIARAFRAARAAGNEEAFAETQGLDLSFLQQVAEANPAGSEELYDQAFRAQRGPQRMAEAQVFSALLEGRTAEEAIEANLPALQAAAQAGGFEFDAENARFQTDLLEFDQSEGISRAKLRLEGIQANLGAEQAERYVDFVNSIDQSTPEGRHLFGMAATAAVNPNFAQHIQFHEGLESRKALQLAASRGSPGDIAALTLRIREAINEATDRAIEAEDAGNDDIQNAAVADLNNLRSMYNTLANQGLVFPMDVLDAGRGRGWMGGEKGIDLSVMPFESDRARVTAQNVLDAVQSTSPEEAQAVIQRYSNQLPALKSQGWTNGEIQNLAQAIGMIQAEFTTPPQQSPVFRGPITAPPQQQYGPRTMGVPSFDFNGPTLQQGLEALDRLLVPEVARDARARNRQER